MNLRSTSIKGLLIIIYLIISNEFLFHTLIEIGHNDKFKMFFYALGSSLFLILIVFIFLEKKSITKIIICIPLVLSAFFSQLHSDITGNIINIDSISLSINNLSSLGAFWGEYQFFILKNVLILILGFFVIIFDLKSFMVFKNIKYFYSRSVLVFLLTCSLFFSISRGGYGQHGLPSQVNFLIPFVLSKFSKNIEIKEIENFVSKSISKKSKILIIDESISYNFFLKALHLNKNISKNDIFKNLKRFYSIHNCSAQSLWSLINGLGFKDGDYFIQKNIWEISKKNGYENIYISAQETKNSYQYLQKPNELILLDKKFFYGNFQREQRDQRILEDLPKILNLHKKQFIIIIKNGSHFPYKDQFDYTKYNLNEKDEKKIMYKYSILENSIKFLIELKKLLDINDIELVYLSDHGQNVESDKVPHCNSVKPNINEWEIPLLFYNFNKNINTTLLSNMSLYGVILESLGVKVKHLPLEKHHLFYGNINKRFKNVIKRKEINILNE